MSPLIHMGDFVHLEDVSCRRRFAEELLFVCALAVAPLRIRVRARGALSVLRQSGAAPVSGLRPAVGVIALACREQIGGSILQTSWPRTSRTSNTKEKQASTNDISFQTSPALGLRARLACTESSGGRGEGPPRGRFRRRPRTWASARPRRAPRTSG